MSQYCRAGKVIDRYYVDAFHVVDLAIYQSADAAKTIDCNFYCAHVV